MLLSSLPPMPVQEVVLGIPVGVVGAAGAADVAAPADAAVDAAVLAAVPVTAAVVECPHHPCLPQATWQLLDRSDFQLFYADSNGL